ncbi:transcription initiation factor TFIID subunit 4-like isoform X2 [Antennarius striatus]|uniref:transcription initiation factor TFIID subunit 4-like isoform X2 n=1 Tax=Antennarius striatus TaxID=241820 RepID=UPI0035B1F56E
MLHLMLTVDAFVFDQGLFVHCLLSQLIMTTDQEAVDPTLLLQVSAPCGPISAPEGCPQRDRVSAQPKVTPPVQSHPPPSSTITASVPRLSSPLMVIAKVSTPARVGADGDPRAAKPAQSQGASTSQAAPPGGTVVIAVPRTAPLQAVAVAPQLPGGVHMPPGMVLLRSGGGQLMLVSHHALAQAQQGPRSTVTPANRAAAPQAPADAGAHSKKVVVVRMTAPPRVQAGPVQETAVVKGVGGSSTTAAGQAASSVCETRRQACVQTDSSKEPAAFTEETLESVKKCKNFLVTLIKLASSGSRSAHMAVNVRGLVKSLLEGRLEAEAFTQQLYDELRSTPQPCLVPFLQKSLPAVRCLTPDPQLFIQQASTSTFNPNTLCSSVKQSNANTKQNSSDSHQSPGGPPLRPGLASRTDPSWSSRPVPRHTTVPPEEEVTGTLSVKKPPPRDPPWSRMSAFQDGSGSYREDDDINDVTSMAGVNLREENAQILTTVVGSVVQSCLDPPFLSPHPVVRRVLHKGQDLGVTDVCPEVVALLSHATQEFLRDLLQKLTWMAERRKTMLKEDLWHAKVSDLCPHLRTLEEVGSVKTMGSDEEETERSLRLTRLQPIEVQLLQREANNTALAAVGPGRKRVHDPTDNKVTPAPSPGAHSVSQIRLRDVLLCMELHCFFRHSVTLYRAMI